VREGDEVDLKKWPTKVEPVYKSKEQYEKLLEEHVSQLSSQQQLLYASNHYALLLIFQAMDAAGKDGAISHVTSGVNPQGCQVFSSSILARRNCNTRFSLAHHTRSAGTRADRYLQPLLL
jgi:polyphosphate kinase 2 (PPK2 family)